MSTKSVLVSFAGYPFTPSSLMLDNGLANLTSSLLQKGHSCEVLDYGTVDVIERLSPGKYGREVYDLSQKIMGDLRAGGSFNPKDKKRLQTLEGIISRRQDAATKDIAKEIASKVKEEKISLVGLKLWSGDGFFGSVRIAEEVKRQNPDVAVVAGGPQVDYFGEHILGITKAFDTLVFGEGEETIRDLAKYAEGELKLDRIPNLIFRKNGEVIKTPIKRIEDLDTLPTAVYDSEIYHAMKGDNKFHIITIDEIRGCFYGKCNFCIQPFKSGSYLRKRSPGKLVGDIKQFIKKYGISVFKYAGSATPPQHAKSIAKEVIENKLDIDYTMFCIAAGYNQDAFRLLKESGLHAVFFGGESGSANQLKYAINKPTTPEQLGKSILAAKEAGVYTIASFIFPTPGETDDTRNETLRFIQETRPDSVPVTPPGVLPNTNWANNPKKFGISLDEDYLQGMMNLKIKLLFPAILWPPFPYTINRQTSPEFAARSAKFSQEIEKMGILTFISDELKLLAKYSGLSAAEYRDKTKECLVKGDYSAMRNIVSRTNSKILSRL